jgi:hypothetical protein
LVLRQALGHSLEQFFAHEGRDRDQLVFLAVGMKVRNWHAALSRFQASGPELGL